MRKIAILLCVSLILGLFAGCGSEQDYVPTGNGLYVEEETVEATVSPVETPQTEFSLAYYTTEGFNPYAATALNNQMIFSLVYQGLFTMTPDYAVEGVLCASYVVSADYTVHTFTLENATFSDGSFVTATDVVASLQAAKEGQVYSGRFRHIKSITALDAKTVEIITSTAYENLPMLLDIPITKADQMEAAVPLGTGPYVLSTRGAGYVLTRRANWWCKANLTITQDVIALEGFETAAQVRDGFQFSDVGISLTDPGVASYAEYRGDYELWDVENGVFLYLVCNANSPVFSNDQIRAALTSAIDRAQILQTCYKGFGHTAVLPASPSSPFYSMVLANTVKYDPFRLAQILIDNAVAGSTVTLLVNKDDSVRLQAARMIAQMLTDCGLVVELSACSTSQYRSALKNGLFDLYLGQTKLSASMDLTQFFASGGDLSYGSLADSAIYEVCKKALENSGNFYNLHKNVLDDGQLIPILFRTYGLYARRGLATELDPARDNVFFYSLGKGLASITTVDYEE